ncbi:MAG: Flp pilus assembly complex ATPase component TadA [Candidatus Sericytochromatia bacterium]|nr:Flp pilus assembly complex ATPase component TadA [Candidatus Sericytochromatia bacterium]
MALVRKRLGEILLEAGMISEDQLEEALVQQKNTSKSLGQILIESNYVTESNIKDALELQFGISYVNVKTIKLNADLLNMIPENLMRQRQIIPVNFVNNNLTIAMVNPQDLPAIDDVRLSVSKKIGKSVTVRAVVITEDDFYSFLNEQLDSAKTVTGADPKKGPVGIALDQEHDTGDIVSEMDVVEADDDLDEGDETDSEAAPIIRLANAILANALKKKASDIHIEPQEHELRLRYRIDGVLHTEPHLPKRIANALASRFKIITNLNIAEKRLPQDGRLRRRIGGRNIDFRVSTLPSKHGEKIVMRILDNSNTQLGLEKLMIYPELLKAIREYVQRPYGIIFVTGPTGSGKTTSLYSILAERNTPDVNISTAEDPIEYDLAGITQSQAQPDIGLTFARILKAFLRQDPDIMLIGETRDKELAHIAIESALTGHLVFTSLHTNDAPGAITRLQEMGIDGFLISSSTICVLAQRLVRRMCPECKVLYEPDDALLYFVGYPFWTPGGERIKIYKHNEEGCDACSSGYKGRMGVYELMAVNDEMREAINKDAVKSVIRQAAKRGGMVPLKEYSLMLVRDGYTDLDEVLRVTMTDEGAEDGEIPIGFFPPADVPEPREPMMIVPPRKPDYRAQRKAEQAAQSGAAQTAAQAAAQAAAGSAFPTGTAASSSLDAPASDAVAIAAASGEKKKGPPQPKVRGALPAAGQSSASAGDRCPSCLATVEAEWETCPYCFTTLKQKV